MEFIENVYQWKTIQRAGDWHDRVRDSDARNKKERKTAKKLCALVLAHLIFSSPPVVTFSHWMVIIIIMTMEKIGHTRNDSQQQFDFCCCCCHCCCIHLYSDSCPSGMNKYIDCPFFSTHHIPFSDTHIHSLFLPASLVELELRFLLCSS